MKNAEKKAEAKRWGEFAESLAMEHMVLEGYIVRERNWRPKNSHLEVDLICEKDSVMVFVEVKARRGTDYDPADAISDSKISKLIRAAEIYLAMQDRDYEYRFDIFTVSGDYDDYDVDYIPDAFLPKVG